VKSLSGLYSFEQFESDVQALKPRFFDTYILPPFMVWYGMKSKGMNKLARRMLFTAGIYLFYRNYREYKAIYTRAIAALKEQGEKGFYNV
jgi:hypothetical protein